MGRDPKCRLRSTSQASLQLDRDTKSQGFRCHARGQLGPQILHPTCLFQLAPLAPAPLSDLVSRLDRRVRSTGLALVSKQENKIACAPQAEYAEMLG